jgi:hypothetical protein
VRRSFSDLGPNPFRNYGKFGAAKAFTGAGRFGIAERDPVRLRFQFPSSCVPPS